MTLDQTFSALGDPTRRAILNKLIAGEATLSDIAAPFDMSQTGVTRHVNVLSRAGLVSVSKRGRTRYCKLRAAPMKQAQDWFNDYQQFWQENLSSLAKHLEEVE